MKRELLEKDRYIDKLLGVKLGFGTLLTQRVAPHYHDFLEIFIINGGCMEHQINGTSSVIQKGDMVFIRAEDTHCFRRHGNNACEIVNLACHRQLEMSGFRQTQMSAFR